MFVCVCVCVFTVKKAILLLSHFHHQRHRNCVSITVSNQAEVTSVTLESDVSSSLHQ